MYNKHPKKKSVYIDYEKIPAEILRPSIFELIQGEKPGFTRESTLSMGELNYYRKKHIENYLTQSMGELSTLDKKVLKTIEDHSILADRLVKEEDEKKLRSSEKIARKIADFCGSWLFIILFLSFIVCWITTNLSLLLNKGFDPYPFILLNLILAFLAAIQAPLIMLNQNKQSEKDRERSKKDYMINLNAEIEIKMLHEKLDHLIMRQQQELLHIQEIQVDMINDLFKKIDELK